MGYIGFFGVDKEQQILGKEASKGKNQYFNTAFLTKKWEGCFMKKSIIFCFCIDIVDECYFRSLGYRNMENR